MPKAERLYLKEWIAKRGITRAELARRVDVQSITIKAWADNAPAPRADALVGLALALDVKVADLFTKP